jgi:hypothetical protein
MTFRVSRFGAFLLIAFSVFGSSTGIGAGVSFEKGDVIVSLESGPVRESGPVQWWLPDGTFRGYLVGREIGPSEGMAFDAAGNLYVTHWCSDPFCSISGNTVEKFNPLGISEGPVGSGYDCGPHAVTFDAAQSMYVGLAGCSGAILKFPPGATTETAPVVFPVAPDTYGAFWIDLAPDGCTMRYTSWGANVKQYNVCTGAQLPDFNVAPLPSPNSMDLRNLPDGGVLVSSGDVIARLDASGALVRTYQVEGESPFWTGLDLVGDGTFWAGAYYTSNVYRFDLATGLVLTTFNTGTASHTVVGVTVKK